VNPALNHKEHGSEMAHSTFHQRRPADFPSGVNPFQKQSEFRAPGIPN